MDSQQDLDWMRCAYKIALASTDKSTQNAAIIVDRSGARIASGFNDIVPAVDRPDRRERPAKYLWTEHAERAAIYEAARRGTRTFDCTMYCPWAPCIECARAIVYAGIRRLVVHDLPQHREQGRWDESIAAGELYLAACSVTLTRLRGVVGQRIRFGGVEIDV